MITFNNTYKIGILSNLEFEVSQGGALGPALFL